MKWLRSLRGVRPRLTLAYTAALAAVLLVYSGAVYALVRRSFLAELDQELHEDFESAEAMLALREDGGVRWRAEREPREEREYLWIEVRDAHGAFLFRDPPGRDPGQDPASDSPARRGPESVALPDGRSARLMTRPFLLGDHDLVISAARSEAPLRVELGRLLTMMALSIPLAALATGATGYFLARRALAPVDRITARARTISAERLSARLPVDDPGDELGRLALAFNETFQRLERSFEGLRRFTADASHELRTPLTVLRSVGDVALRRPRDEQGYREVIGSMLEEVDRLTRLVDDLLMLSRADGQQLELARTPLDLAALAREAVSGLEVLADEKQQTIEFETDGPLRVDADRLMLRHALLNLLDNAVKYSPRGARIRLRALNTAAGAALEVSDTGPGIAREHHERVFERFYRVDPARSSAHGGAGLGLSIARWTVEAHGGRIELESELGKGSTFRVVLPFFDESDRRHGLESETGIAGTT